MRIAQAYLALVLTLALLGLGAATAPAQKYGGTLNALSRGNPANLNIHQTSTITTVFPMMPIYNNLVLYDQLKPQESPDTIVPELAESWSWSADHKNLTFRLHRGVKWHDGKPFTSKDVKMTWDDVRGVSGRRLKLNPRKLWWDNVTDVTTNGDHEVTFHLKRPQPAILAMLASGYSPVLPAHIEPSRLRTEAIGTGPFKLHKYERDQKIELVKNQDYFVKGRPYLDGIHYLTIKSRSSRFAALVANQADITFPGETTKPIYEGLQRRNLELVFHQTIANSSNNVIFNPHKPPFNDERMRVVVSLALDREGFVKGLRQGGALQSGALLPPPYGVWGLTQEQLNSLPGYGDARKNKAKAREIMKKLGFGPDKHFKVTISTRAIATYIEMSNWVIAELKDVWIDAELEQIESGNWYGKLARKDYVMGVNSTGTGPDDPDANFYENYACGSQRNYTGYCDPETTALMERMSAEVNFQKRRQLAQEIDMKLQREAARPMLGFRYDYRTWWNYVKNVVPHQSHYSYHRMQEVWLDK